MSRKLAEQLLSQHDEHSEARSTELQATANKQNKTRRKKTQGKKKLRPLASLIKKAEEGLNSESQTLSRNILLMTCSQKRTLPTDLLKKVIVPNQKQQKKK
ncbi:unnamed protein product [Heterosigma akashiwo]